MKLITTIASAILFTVSSTGAQAAPQYKITNIGDPVTLGGTSSQAYDINNSGYISGRYKPVTDGVAGTQSGFLYNSNTGTTQNLGNFGGSRTSARASNSSNQVVGYSRPNEGSSEYNAFLYKDGVLNNLGTLGTGNYSYAHAINESGQVAGHSHTNGTGTTSEAFIYENGSMTSIGTLGGKSAGAFDINDNGIITGTSTTASTDTQGFIYQDGVMTSLGSLDGTGYSEARAINNKNQIVGNSLSENGNYHTFLYEDGIMQDLGTLGGDSFAYDINEKGQVVGGHRSHLLESSNSAYIYTDGEMFDLTSLLSASDQESWVLKTAYSINDAGQIVGWGSFNGSNQAFLLTSVPVPAAVFLLTPALGLLGFMGKRRKTS